jgi:hypothetical protein
MTGAPPTPGEDVEPGQPSPTENPSTNEVYDETFENDLMKTILHPPAAPMEPTSNPNLPFVPPSSLPLPLASLLRTYPSPITGVLLTHPHGSVAGGPGPSPEEVSAFAKAFIEEHGITNEKDLAKKVDEVVKMKMGELRERAAKREEAVQANERVRKEIKNLELQREAEKRVEESIRKDRERKRQRG